MIENRTIFTRDNLDIMQGMDSESVDLIYLDPPFNSNRHYQAPVGSKAAGAAFKDAWTFEDTDDAWWGLIAEKHPALYKVIDAAGAVGNSGDKSYLIYMAMRVLEMSRILKPTGSIYLHCDPTMGHSLKMMMDSIFGKRNFRNDIIWHYSGWNAILASKFNSRHDIILFYGYSHEQAFNSYAIPWENEQEYIKARKQKVHLDKETNRKYVLSDAGGGKRVRRFLDEAMQYGKPVSDVWVIDKINNSSKENTGYPTQKPLALLERIIKSSSNEGDMVFDPFCGCATTLIAAEKEKRQWIGIDISPKAVDLVKDRLHQTFQIGEGGEGELAYKSANVIHRTDMPIRSDHATPPSRDIKHVLFGKQKGVCNGCKHDFPFQNFTLDHIQPTSRGGADTNANLQLLCGHCNSVKSNGTMAELIARLRESSILH